MDATSCYEAGKVDIIVIGAGHAGIEAGLAGARLGRRTAVFTINLDAVGNMPCNPSIGGTGKGHLVREIDALGGEMGRLADQNALQTRMLNRGKGPAVHSLRMQIDRRHYQESAKKVLENQENLLLIQAEVTEVFVEDGHAAGIVTRFGAIWRADAIIIATGTFLRGKILVGDVDFPGGPDGLFPSEMLTESLRRIGLPLVRFKTGTPPRVSGKTIDYTNLERQDGDENPEAFSFEDESPEPNRMSCFVTYTTPETHRIIRENLHRSPLYAGKIEGVGPRYCPSIEDKVVRFADKERHQLFLEPMGLNTDEVYVQGFSSSLPEEVQRRMLATLPGMEHAVTMRTAYAIEYDCIDPTALKPTMEVRSIPGLYGAGQFNGSSGYEEAAAQGLVAGVNAALAQKGEEPMILGRADGYIGLLIDDLVTKGTNEPYRVMTSRSEYRLLLRQDNADERMMPIGHRIGLVSDERYAKFIEKYDHIRAEEERLEATSVSPNEKVNAFLEQRGSTRITTGIRLGELLRRPEITYQELAEIDDARPELAAEEASCVEIRVKYSGYIRRQKQEVERFRKLEEKQLPDGIDYKNMEGLRLEARTKLDKIRPQSVGQASRIPGVSPADISVLLIRLAAGNTGSAEEGEEKGQ